MNAKKINKKIIACPCCGLMISNDTVINAYMVLKKIFPEMQCTSWTRCKKHNEEIGGAPQSKHLDGKALDLTYTGGEMLAELIYMGRMLGLKRAFIYERHVHLDCFGKKPYIGTMVFN